MFRLSLSRSLRALRLQFNFDIDAEIHFSPSHNISPGCEHPVVASNAVMIGQWGIPSDNVSEPVIVIPISSSILPSLQRCAIPLDGAFLEVPTLRFFHHSRGAVFFGAAVMDSHAHFALVSDLSRPTDNSPEIEFPIFFAADSLPQWESDGSVTALLALEDYAVMRTPIIAGHTGPECVRPWRLDVSDSLDAVVRSTCKFQAGMKRAINEKH
jgi:hypothetical protein